MTSPDLGRGDPARRRASRRGGAPERLRFRRSSPDRGSRARARMSTRRRSTELHRRLLLLAPLFAALAWGAAARAQDSCADWAQGLSSLPGMDGSVSVLKVVDTGSGAALYAGGSFTLASSVFANR